MKVILLEDIKGVGKKGDLYEASDGYARNFLMPKKKAIEATKANMNELALKQKAIEAKQQREVDEARELAAKLESQTIKVFVKTGENGKLFGSVTGKEIAAAISEQHNIPVDKKKVSIQDTIKSVGEVKAEVKLHPKISAKIKVEVCEAN